MSLKQQDKLPPNLCKDIELEEQIHKKLGLAYYVLIKRKGRFMSRPFKSQTLKRWRRCSLKKSDGSTKIIFPDGTGEVEVGTPIRIHHNLICDNINEPPVIEVKRAYVLQE